MPPGAWHVATLAGNRAETATAATLIFDCPDWPGHRAGQHVDVRLTAEDGYQAQRSSSIASAPEDERLELTVERIDDGEVSPYLVEDMLPGDALELRGPIGLWFTWDAIGDGGPLLLVAGGSGVVPLRAMLRHRAAADPHVPARLLLSARSAADVIYAAELASAMASNGSRPTPAPPARLDRLPPARRPRDARGRRLQTRRAAAHLRLRPDGVRRGSQRGARRPRPSAHAREDRALRPTG